MRFKSNLVQEATINETTIALSRRIARNPHGAHLTLQGDLRTLLFRDLALAMILRIRFH